MKKTLPKYATRLDALHRALSDDFRRLVARVPLRGSESVLDAGCGDGFFTKLLADRLPEGAVIALDRSEGYLHEMEERLEPWVENGSIRPALGNVISLPFPDCEFDVVWSAHSMQSYPAIRPVLAEFHRVLKSGGLLAVLETDNLHSVMLNWPPEVELAMCVAEHHRFVNGTNDCRVGAYFPRFAESLLRDAGFDQIMRHYEFVHRHPPVDEAVEAYVRMYLKDLLKSVGTRLDDATRRMAHDLTDPDSPRFLPRDENFYFGSLQTLFVATAGHELAFSDGLWRSA